MHAPKILGRLAHTSLVCLVALGFPSESRSLDKPANTATPDAVWLVEGREKERRPNMFDHSLQVPLIVRWPGTVKPGAEVKELVSNIDTFASVLGMLKVPPLADYKQEGKDFSPLLRGEKIAWRDAYAMQMRAAIRPLQQAAEYGLLLGKDIANQDKLPDWRPGDQFHR
jgi:arylsulfatase A-like enzyme